MIRVTALAAIIVFAAAPAIAGHHEITADDVAQFKVGVAAYSDVVAKLGKPTQISLNSSGQRMIVYAHVHSGPKAATFIPYVGLFAGGAKGKGDFVAFTFGPDGVLQSSSASEVNVNCGSHFFSYSCQGGGFVLPETMPGAAQKAAESTPPPAAPAVTSPAPVAAAHPPQPAPQRAARQPCIRVVTDPTQNSC